MINQDELDAIKQGVDLVSCHMLDKDVSVLFGHLRQ